MELFLKGQDAINDDLPGEDPEVVAEAIDGEAGPLNGGYCDTYYSTTVFLKQSCWCESLVTFSCICLSVCLHFFVFIPSYLTFHQW